MIKCVRCKSSENILNYRHVVKETSGSRRYSTTTIKSGTVPACRDCIKLFNKWKIIKIILYVILIPSGFFTFWALLASFSYDLFGIGYWTGLNPFIILIIGIPIIIVASIFSYKKSKAISARSFIKFETYGEIKVKPQGYNEWMPLKTWLVKTEPVKQVPPQHFNRQDAIMVEDFSDESIAKMMSIIQGTSPEVIKPGMKIKEGMIFDDKKIPAFKAYHISPVALKEADKDVIELVDRGKISDALKAIDQKLTSNPNDITAYKLKAAILDGLGKVEATKWIDKGLEINPDDPDLLISKAQLQGAIGNFEEEINIHSRVLKLYPDYPFALTNRGYAYFNSGQNEKAIEDLNRSIELDPNIALTWEFKGIYYLNYEKDVDEALKCFDKAIKIDPEVYKSWNNRGATLTELKRYKEAFDSINNALKVNPDYEIGYRSKEAASHNMINVFLNEAKDHFKSGDFSEAIKLYDEILELEPNNTTALINKGNSLSE
ncbi:MAG: tetratricopeptide repeat protein, partial [Candidatus Odinarchaeota archaeon]